MYVPTHCFSKSPYAELFLPTFPTHLNLLLDIQQSCIIQNNLQLRRIQPSIYLLIYLFIFRKLQFSVQWLVAVIYNLLRILSILISRDCQKKKFR